MTDPIARTSCGTGVIEAYVCAACGKVFPVTEQNPRPSSAAQLAWQAHVEVVREDAENCCAVPKCVDCGGFCGKFFRRCSVCADKARATSSQARFEKVRHVPAADYTGQMLYLENGEGVYASSFDDLWAQGFDVTWAWATEPVMLELNAQDILTSALEAQEFDDDAYDRIGDDKAELLQAFLDMWCKHANVVCHTPDFTQAVVAPPKPAEAREL